MKNGMKVNLNHHSIQILDKMTKDIQGIQDHHFIVIIAIVVKMMN